jgi:hypothetical protein
MDGRAYLEKLIADRLGAGKGQPRLGRQGALNRFEIRGVAIGLVAAGTLEPEVADQIVADLDVTLVRAGWLKQVRAEMETFATTPVAQRLGAERPEWRQAIEDPPTPALRAVVPLAGSTVTVGDTTAGLISLEVWTTMIALNLAHIGVEPPRLRTVVDRTSAGVAWTMPAPVTSPAAGLLRDRTRCWSSGECSSQAPLTTPACSP